MDDFLDFIENSSLNCFGMSDEEVKARITKPPYSLAVEYLSTTLERCKSPLEKLRCITHSTVLIT
jgi:hypothetical protein